LRAFIDNLRLAFGTFIANPLRTVVTMMALLEGLSTKVNHDMSQLGANVFRVDKWPVGIHIGGNRLNWNKIGNRPPLTVLDRKAIVEHSPSVTLASASSGQPGQKISTAAAETQPSVFVVGATVDYSETSGIVIASGRFFNEADDVDGRRVTVLGPDVADKLFPNADPIGQEVRLKTRPYTVVGVLERRGKVLGLFNLDNMIFIPMNTYLANYGKRRSVSINVQARDKDAVDRGQEEVIRLLRTTRKVPPAEENNFELSTNESMAKTLNDLSKVITAATFGVCFLSLLVGGIGILNIMLVAVTERTKEIGVRKALGATRRRILFQFATEAVVLSLVGGIIGIAAGFGLAFLGRWTLGLYTSVPTWAVALSLGMSSGVGLLFGIYPAWRAAKLDPIEAMRSE
jgi:putative ABC transport system permease protein